MAPLRFEMAFAAPRLYDVFVLRLGIGGELVTVL